MFKQVLQTRSIRTLVSSSRHRDLTRDPSPKRGISRARRQIPPSQLPGTPDTVHLMIEGWPKALGLARLRGLLTTHGYVYHLAFSSKHTQAEGTRTALAAMTEVAAQRVHKALDQQYLDRGGGALLKVHLRLSRKDEPKE